MIERIDSLPPMTDYSPDSVVQLRKMHISIAKSSCQFLALKAGCRLSALHSQVPKRAVASPHQISSGNLTLICLQSLLLPFAQHAFLQSGKISPQQAGDSAHIGFYKRAGKSKNTARVLEQLKDNLRYACQPSRSLHLQAILMCYKSDLEHDLWLTQILREI